MNFEAAFSDVRPILLSMALRYTRNRDEAEDLVQETALKAFRFQASYNPSHPFKNWCMRMLQNTHYDNIRRAKRRVPTEPLPDDFDVVDSARAFFDQVDGAVAADELLDMIEQVYPLSTAILALVAEGESYREIADEVGLPMQTVATRLIRARRLLMPLLN